MTLIYYAKIIKDLRAIALVQLLRVLFMSCACLIARSRRCISSSTLTAHPTGRPVLRW